jgi:arylsulfatase A-like enzyme
MSSPRNLIIFLPDQQRADTLAVYGNAKVHAPNLNKLASESVVFKRAYITQPVCSPSRTTLLTGAWPHTTGCTNNGFAPAKKLRFLPELIGNADYRSAYIGKWHLGDPGPTKRGFHEFVSVERVSDYSKFLISKGLKPDHEGGGFSALTISNLPIELSQPQFLERHACEFIERNRSKSFVLVISFVEPHSPYNGPLNDEHALEEVDVDPSASAPLPDDTPLRYRLTREWQRDRASNDATGKIRRCNFGVTIEDYRELKRKYFGLITLVDQSIGAILATLENCGLRDQTVIAHTSDHGDLLGAHQLFGKGVMFEQAAHVPLFIRAPDLQPRIVDQAVSHIDFVPTLLELMDAAQSGQCAGKSRAPLMRGESMPAESIFLEWSPYKRYQKRIKQGTTLAPAEKVKEAALESTRAVITPDGWKLCLRDSDLNELYSLKDDPDEIRNLYYSGEHREIISRCREEIQRWQNSTADKIKLSE